MDKTQQKKLYIAAIATSLPVIALMVLAFMRWKDTTIQQDYEDKVAAYQSALDTDPYPNAANIKELKAKTAELTEATDALRATYTHLPKRLEGDFSNSLRNSVTALNQKQMPSLMSAETGATAVVPVEMTQEYCFDTYLSKGLLPQRDHLDRLLLQYSIVEDVVTTLLDVAPEVDGKKEVVVTKVQRVIFDKRDTAATDAKNNRRSTRSNNKKKNDDPVANFAGPEIPKELTKEIHRESFEISFRTRHSVVAKFLNALNTSATIYDVSSIKIMPVITLDKEVEAKNTVKKTATTTRTSRRNAKKTDEPEKPTVESLANRLVPNPKTASLVDVTIAFDVRYAEVDEKETKAETADEEPTEETAPTTDAPVVEADAASATDAPAEADAAPAAEAPAAPADDVPPAAPAPATTDATEDAAETAESEGK